MSATILAYEPDSVVAGDTVQWMVDVPDYPPTEWVLSYALRGQVDAQEINITGTSLNGSHLISVAPGVTAQWAPGSYSYQGYVTKGSDRVCVRSGSITVKPNFATTNRGIDSRGHNQKCLDLIMAAIEGRIPNNIESYNIGGRDIRKIPLVDLVKLKNQYLNFVNQEKQQARIAKGLGTGRNIFVRFGKPSSGNTPGMQGLKW